MRLAFNYAFDFEEMNRRCSSGEYERINSYFSGTELASEGLPSGKELEILETVRDKVPPEVFTKPFVNPRSPAATRRGAPTCARRRGFCARRATRSATASW